MSWVIVCTDLLVWDLCLVGVCYSIDYRCRISIEVECMWIGVECSN